MIFEEITLISNDAFHRYLIEGSVEIKSNGYNRKLSINCNIGRAIDLNDSLSKIKVNGIEFECSNIQILEKKIIGEIIEVTSFDYTERFS